MGISRKSFFILVLTVSVVNPAIWVSRQFGSFENFGANSPKENPHRTKRSPFIMAFQVTRPPGMFQLALRRPYIFNMMSNLTSMILTSNITNMLRRGFAGTFPALQSDNATTVRGIESRQEDLEIMDK